MRGENLKSDGGRPHKNLGRGSSSTQEEHVYSMKEIEKVFWDMQDAAFLCTIRWVSSSKQVKPKFRDKFEQLYKMKELKGEYDRLKGQLQHYHDADLAPDAIDKMVQDATELTIKYNAKFV